MHNLSVLVLLACGGADSTPSTPATTPSAKKLDAPDGEPKLLPMTREALDKAIIGLEPCYESAVDGKADLKGTWVLDMVIRRDGSVKLKSVVGEGVSDLTLEDCITEKVKAWDLPTIPVAVPARKSVVFGPSEPNTKAVEPAEGGAVDGDPAE